MEDKKVRWGPGCSFDPGGFDADPAKTDTSSGKIWPLNGPSLTCEARGSHAWVQIFQLAVTENLEKKDESVLVGKILG